jgi:hypothetical protein
MRISESVTQEWTLASAPAGQAVEVVEVGSERPEQLLVHGIRQGRGSVVELDALARDRASSDWTVAGGHRSAARSRRPGSPGGRP